MIDYSVNTQLFFDLWRKYDCKEEISNPDEIFNFLTDLIQISEGQVVVEHFSHANYDYITRIERVDQYLKIVWRDYNNLRTQYLSGHMSEGRKLEWEFFGNTTFIYTLLDVEKIKILNWDDHIFLLFRTNLIEPKTAERFLLRDKIHILNKNRQPSRLYATFRFVEGDPANYIIHDCTVCTLPFFSLMIRPKNPRYYSALSHLLLVQETLQEIRSRFNRVVNSLSVCPEQDSDEIAAKGSTIRKLMEYALKYFCIYQNIPLQDLDQKYKYTYLGDLRKTVRSHGLIIPQSLIDDANKFSHDSGHTYHIEEVLLFASQTNALLTAMETKISKEVYDRYPYLFDNSKH